MDLGYSLDHVKDQLGHKTINPTLRYAERKRKFLINALDDRRKVVPFLSKKQLR